MFSTLLSELEMEPVVEDVYSEDEGSSMMSYHLSTNPLPRASLDTLSEVPLSFASTSQFSGKRFSFALALSSLSLLC
jgi:hypothetical protein